MSVLIFRLNGVEEDEADDIRQLLRDNELEFYESDAGSWGLAVAAIWLCDASQTTRARALIDTYQRQRQQKIRADASQREPMPSLIARIKQAPLRYLLTAIVVATVIYLSIWPFLRLASEVPAELGSSTAPHIGVIRHCAMRDYARNYAKQSQAIAHLPPTVRQPCRYRPA